ncbi:tripartite tricarboxylate transporter TctB family protein [Lentibacillus amyloliquefaciens]|uniref:DUF1468 domain-containing protein n=1 Tax=Lentibacillus amyloliquefaciens TaxID=1472767 RepID=A0A0U3WCN4_9BACI|nr:tripartite tricarboxylate transporter TctB family protein [Lentibacillus amyloliquefaciens]ALX47567.1 hypothetical protein AOX59_02480 [Lentibacillus amyloliquefaciens]
MTERKRERYTGFFLLIVSILLLILIPFGIKESAVSSGVGSAFFPKVLAVSMIILSISIIAKTFFNKGTEEEHDELVEEEAAKEQVKPNYWNVLIVLLIMLIYIFVLIEYLNFVVSTIIAMVAVMAVLSVRKWYSYIIVIAFIVLTDYVFRELLSIQLP